MKKELINKLESMVAKIAETEIDFNLCSDGIAIVTWEGTSEQPFKNLCKVFGNRAFDFDIDTELGFDYAGCMLDFNK